MAKSQMTIGSAELYVGPAGWSYADWKGIVYPEDAPKWFRGLKFLAGHFNTVELNNTFYRPPKPSYCKAWLRDVQDRADFSFTAKLWQRFTHEREERWSAGDVELFRSSIAPITDAGMLGAIVVQFPWSFRYGDQSKDWLKMLVSDFADLPLVVEVRSSEWICDEALGFIKDMGVGFCNIDQPHLRQNIPLTSYGFGEVGYLRMHGRNAKTWFADDAGRDKRYDYLYSPSELDEIRGAVERIAEQVERIYVIANNHYRGQGPANALQLMEQLTQGEVPVPELLAQHYDFPWL